MMNANHKLVPAPAARRDYLGNISAMSEHRWRKAAILPEPIKINGRNYYRESDLIALQDRFARDSGGEARNG